MITVAQHGAAAEGESARVYNLFFCETPRGLLADWCTTGTAVLARYHQDKVSELDGENVPLETLYNDLRTSEMLTMFDAFMDASARFRELVLMTENSIRRLGDGAVSNTKLAVNNLGSTSGDDTIERLATLLETLASNEDLRKGFESACGELQAKCRTDLEALGRKVDELRVRQVSDESFVVLVSQADVLQTATARLSKYLGEDVATSLQGKLSYIEACVSDKIVKHARRAEALAHSKDFHKAEQTLEKAEDFYASFGGCRQRIASASLQKAVELIIFQKPTATVTEVLQKLKHSFDETQLDAEQVRLAVADLQLQLQPKLAAGPAGAPGVLMVILALLDVKAILAPPSIFH
jgi:hypothetical protein